MKDPPSNIDSNGIRIRRTLEAPAKETSTSADTLIPRNQGVWLNTFAQLMTSSRPSSSSDHGSSSINLDRSAQLDGLVSVVGFGFPSRGSRGFGNERITNEAPRRTSDVSVIGHRTHLTETVRTADHGNVPTPRCAAAPRRLFSHPLRRYGRSPPIIPLFSLRCRGGKR